MDELNSLHYDETPKSRFIRYVVLGTIAIFIITVTIIALVEGFKTTGQTGHAFLGITVFFFTFLTFALHLKTIKGQLPDSARIPVYLQLCGCVFFGISILMTIFSEWHPPALDCYYDNPKTFARQSSPQCWEPPSCFRSTSSCIMYGTLGAKGDTCAPVTQYKNNTNGAVTYTCKYTYKTTTTTTTKKPESLKTYDAFE